MAFLHGRLRLLSERQCSLPPLLRCWVASLQERAKEQLTALPRRRVRWTVTVDTLLRSNNPGQNPTAQNFASDSRAELVRLFSTSFKSGSEMSQADRSYVSKVVAARTGLSEQDADKRVAEVTAQVKSDLDKARKATAQLAFWLAASLLIGAFSAALAATEGGGLRDGTWGRNRAK